MMNRESTGFFSFLSRAVLGLPTSQARGGAKAAAMLKASPALDAEPLTLRPLAGGLRGTEGFPMLGTEKPTPCLICDRGTTTVGDGNGRGLPVRPRPHAYFSRVLLDELEELGLPESTGLLRPVEGADWISSRPALL
uniref:Uncharacterized protein n=1 Tax=Ixodes ricinus TaxID=34613 RepID=A0A6B0USC1_IXORI